MVEAGTLQLDAALQDRLVQLGIPTETDGIEEGTGSELREQIDVSQQARRVEIPALSIQPLVENAVKHGISRKAEGGSIRLEAAVEEGALEITVSDDGPGFPSSGPRENGQGLENVRRRLRLCYGEQGRLQVQSAAGRTKVGFRVPLEKQPAAVLSK